MANHPSTLAVIVPTAGRPQALAPLAEAFAETTPAHRLVFVCDEEDADSRAEARRYGEILVGPRSYPAKINFGIASSLEPLILCGADDIRPHPHWLERACARLSDEIGFVSLNDLGNLEVMAGEYATLPLVARWYVDRHGPLYHEGYRHNGADLEASMLARARGAFAYEPEAVMEHLHPNYGKAEVDETYRRGGMNIAADEADKRLLAERSHLWK